MSASFVFPILVGLSLDYRVFFLNIMIEMKEKGYSNSEAVAIGLHRTGTVIMTAGFIMVIAFGGLVFSTVSALQQIGFLLFVGVAIDAFINCIIVMPAILVICGEYNYWPRK